MEFRIPLAEYRIPKPRIRKKKFPTFQIPQAEVSGTPESGLLHMGESVFEHIYSPNLRNERPCYKNKNNQRLLLVEQ